MTIDLFGRGGDCTVDEAKFGHPTYCLPESTALNLVFIVNVNLKRPVIVLTLEYALVCFSQSVIRWVRGCVPGGDCVD